MIIIPMGLLVFIAMHTFSFLRTPRNKMLLASSPETKNSCICLGHVPGCSFLCVKDAAICQLNIEEGDWIPTTLVHQHACSSWGCHINSPLHLITPGQWLWAKGMRPESTFPLKCTVMTMSPSGGKFWNVLVLTAPFSF